MLDKSLLTDALSVESIEHQIKKNLLSIEYLEQGLDVTMEVGLRLESGEITIEEANVSLECISDELSLERGVFQRGSPVHRIIAAIKRAIGALVGKTKELFNTLFDSRKKLLKKAEQIRKSIKDIHESSFTSDTVDIGAHAVHIMDGKRLLSPLETINGLFNQSNAASAAAASTNRYISEFEEIISDSEENVVSWMGDNGQLDVLFSEYLSRVGYDKRNEALSNLPLNEPMLGSKEITTQSDVDEAGKFISSIAVKPITGVKYNSITPIDRRSAINLCDAVIEYLKEGRTFTDSRAKLSKSIRTYKDSIDKMYDIFYQSSMNSDVSSTMLNRVRSITKRDLCRDIVKLILDLDKNLYRVCLSSLIWIDKSIKK